MEYLYSVNSYPEHAQPFMLPVAVFYTGGLSIHWKHAPAYTAYYLIQPEDNQCQ